MMYSDKVLSGNKIHSSNGNNPWNGRYSPSVVRAESVPMPMRRCVGMAVTNPSVSSREYNGGFLYGQAELFGGLGDGLLGRPESLSAADICKPSLRHESYPHSHAHSHISMNSQTSSGTPGPSSHSGRQGSQMGHGIEGVEMMESMSGTSSILPISSMPDSSSLSTLTHPSFTHPSFSTHPTLSSHSHPTLHSSMYSHTAMGNMMSSQLSHAHAHSHGHAHHSLGHPLPHSLQHSHPLGGVSLSLHDADSDPRELEAFAERFKQRRIKLGVTQADVGKALANLKLPGVGALSQSTICRFESLTLSHNNMIALKPILHTWLEEAEAQARNKRRDPDAPSVLPMGEKKRKRTSIAAPEKRSLEAYFAVQPRPSGEKIAAIAEKLDLKKNVVRVWFCNQRQKQKRMKFAAQHHC